MQESYPVVGKVPTHILTWGKWIEESLNDQKEIVICITGNPGLPGFYTQFLSTIHECLNKEIPVWVIGHAGHDEEQDGPYKKRLPPLEGNESLYSLAGQLQHKVDFIRKYVPSDVKIHLIGHSIGAYLALELLKIPDISDRVQHCYMLFPTIERMVNTKNGFILTRIVKPFYFLVQWFYHCFALLPTVVKVWIIYAYFVVSRTPKHFLGTGLKYINPAVGRPSGERYDFVLSADQKPGDLNKFPPNSDTNWPTSMDSPSYNSPLTSYLGPDPSKPPKGSYFAPPNFLPPPTDGQFRFSGDSSYLPPPAGSGSRT